jgi:hypothetical protein
MPHPTRDPFTSFPNTSQPLYSSSGKKPFLLLANNSTRGKSPNNCTIRSRISCGFLLFTAVTLGTGFKGGEVTPLFFIGAALGNVQTFSAEGDNSRLAMCVQLVDTKEKLQEFFYKHKDLLRAKVVIYKEVEFWDVD